MQQGRESPTLEEEGGEQITWNIGISIMVLVVAAAQSEFMASATAIGISYVGWAPWDWLLAIAISLKIASSIGTQVSHQYLSTYGYRHFIPQDMMELVKKMSSFVCGRASDVYLWLEEWPPLNKVVKDNIIVLITDFYLSSKQKGQMNWKKATERRRCNETMFKVHGAYIAGSQTNIWAK